MHALIAAIITYCVATTLGYALHRAIHQPWMGPLYRAHRAHHVDLYPPGRLISDTYRSAGRQSTVWTFLIVLSPLLLAPLALWFAGIIGAGTALASLAVMAVVGIANDVIHDSFHLRRHWLRRVIPRYNRLRRLHFIHHINTQKNYGIFSFVSDRVFKTFREE